MEREANRIQTGNVTWTVSAPGRGAARGGASQALATSLNLGRER